MSAIDSSTSSPRPLTAQPATPSLTAWETIFNPGGSKAIQVNLIELRDGSGRYNRIYLIALGCITAARSVAEAPVALGRLVIEIIEWGIDFDRTYGELGELIHTEVSDCLRCLKMAFIITGLNVGGIFAPSWSFGALKNMPRTVDLQTTEKNLELSKLQKECLAFQQQVTDLQNKLKQAEKDFTTQKKNLDQILQTTGKQGESLAEARRLQAEVDSLTDKVKTYETQLETLSKKFATRQETVNRETNTASAELTAIKGEIITERETLDQCRATLKALTEKSDALKKEHADLLARQTDLTNNIIPSLTQKETALQKSTETLTASQTELTGKIELKTAEILTQEKALGEKQAELTKLQDQISVLERTKGEFERTHMAPLRLEETRLKEATAALQKELDEKTAAHTKLQEALRLSGEERATVTAAVAQLTEEKQQLNAALQSLQQEKAQISKNIENLNAQHTALNRKIPELEQQQKEAKAALDKTTKALEEVQQQNQTTSAKKKEIELAVEQLLEKQTNLGQVVNDLAQQHEKLNTEVAAKKQELERETTRFDTKVGTTQKLLEEEQRLDLKVKESTELLSQLNTKITAKERETADLEKLTAEIAEKQKKLTAETVLLAQAVASAQAREKDIKTRTTEAQTALDEATKALEEAKKQNQVTSAQKETLDSTVNELTQLQKKLETEIAAKKQEFEAEITRVSQEIASAQEREKIVKAKTTQAETNLTTLEQRSKKATEDKIKEQEQVLQNAHNETKATFNKNLKAYMEAESKKLSDLKAQSNAEAQKLKGLQDQVKNLEAKSNSELEKQDQVKPEKTSSPGKNGKKTPTDRQDQFKGSEQTTSPDKNKGKKDKN